MSYQVKIWDVLFLLLNCRLTGILLHFVQSIVLIYRKGFPTLPPSTPTLSCWAVSTLTVTSVGDVPANLVAGWSSTLAFSWPWTTLRTALQADDCWQKDIFLRWSGPSAWNCLPAILRDKTLILDSLKRCLKCLLFTTYCHSAWSALEIFKMIVRYINVHVIIIIIIVLLIDWFIGWIDWLNWLRPVKVLYTMCLQEVRLGVPDVPGAVGSGLYLTR